MSASLFQKLIDMVSIKYQSLSKHPDKPIVVPISNNSEKRKAVKIQYQSTSTFLKKHQYQYPLERTNQYPAYALKSDDSKSRINIQYPRSNVLTNIEKHNTETRQLIITN